jgi:hypothetical protein
MGLAKRGEVNGGWLIKMTYCNKKITPRQTKGIGERAWSIEQRAKGLKD